MDNMSAATPDYYGQLWFDESRTLKPDHLTTRLRAAVIADEYQSWYDLDLGITGSTLSDANMISTYSETLHWIYEYFSEGTLEYYRLIETNNTAAAEAFAPHLAKLGFLFIPIRPQHITSIELVQQKAAHHYMMDAVMNAQQKFSFHEPLIPDEWQKQVLANMQVSDPFKDLLREETFLGLNSVSVFSRPGFPDDERRRLRSLVGGLHSFELSDEAVAKLSTSDRQLLRGLRSEYEPQKQITRFYPRGYYSQAEDEKKEDH